MTSIAHSATGKPTVVRLSLFIALALLTATALTSVARADTTTTDPAPATDPTADPDLWIFTN